LEFDECVWSVQEKESVPRTPRLPTLVDVNEEIDTFWSSTW